MSPTHEYDEDAVCIHCNFDGAEWSHWRHHTWEGRAQPDVRQPECTEHDPQRRASNQKYLAQYREYEYSDD